MKKGAFGAAELSLAMEIGERLLVSGAEISRVEDTITRVCRAYGARRVDVFTITSSIVVTAWGEEETPFTQTRRVTGMAFNMTVLSELNALSRKICARLPENAEVKAEIERIDALAKYSFRQMIGIFAMTALAFTIFFGGTWRDALAAGLIGALMKVAQAVFVKLRLSSLMSALLCSIGGGLIGGWAVSAGLADNMGIIAIGDIMLLIPGMAFTNSIRDMFSGDTISGLLRFTEALVLSVVIALGFALPAALF